MKRTANKKRTGENQEIVGLGVGGEQSGGGGSEVMTCEYRLELETKVHTTLAKVHNHGECP